MPPNALQGQDVPCHATWKDLDWDLILFSFSKEMQLKEILNASNYEVDNQQIIIRKGSLERDGYVGLVFKTEPSERLRFDANVTISIRDNNRTTDLVSSKDITLFRPDLVFAHIPKRIVIDKQGVANEKIDLMKVGFGTLLVSTFCSDDSEADFHIPDEMKKAFEEFANTLNSEICTLKIKYPEYCDFFEEAEKFDYSRKDQTRAELSDLITRLSPSPEFVQDLSFAFATAILKNTDFEAIFIKPIIEFVKTTVGKQILFTTPFLEVELSTEPKRLILEVECKDALGRDLSRLVTPPIELSTEGPGTIQITQLIKWSASNNKEVGN